MYKEYLMNTENLQLFKSFDIKRFHSLVEFFKTTFYESYAKGSEKHQADMIFANEFSKNFYDKVLDHYVSYAIKHNLAPEDLCPYKILSWYGYFLAQHTYFINKSLSVKVISTAIACMQIILEKEEVFLERDFIKGIVRMVLLEISVSKKSPYGLISENNKLGIGINGFYMVFKTASVCKNQQLNTSKS